MNFTTHPFVQRMHDQLKIMVVKIKPRHHPNLEAGGIHYIGDFKEQIT